MQAIWSFCFSVSACLSTWKDFILFEQSLMLSARFSSVKHATIVYICKELSNLPAWSITFPNLGKAEYVIMIQNIRLHKYVDYETCFWSCTDLTRGQQDHVIAYVFKGDGRKMALLFVLLIALKSSKYCPNHFHWFPNDNLLPYIVSNNSWAIACAVYTSTRRFSGPRTLLCTSGCPVPVITSAY